MSRWYRCPDCTYRTLFLHQWIKHHHKHANGSLSTDGGDRG